MSAAPKKGWFEHAQRWAKSPTTMVRELFKIDPQPWQEEVLETFPLSPMVAMTACKGPGKTAVLSWLAWNYLITRPDCNIAATSISGDNLKDGLLKEMSKWYNVGPSFMKAWFTITSTRIFFKAREKDWWMSFRTWPKSGDPGAQADTLAGLHQDYVMFILDESGGIPPSVLVAAEAALSNCVEGHILQAGNPTSLDGALYQAEKDRIEKGGRWKVFNITADPDDPRRAANVSIDWAREQIRKYGRDNPWVMANVLGRFPSGSISTLISEEEVKAAMARWYRPYEIGLAARVMGIDVARQGLDASVIARREGIQLHNLLRYRNVSDGIAGGSISNRIWDEFNADACFVDATGGMGFTWIDGLKVLNKTAIPVQFSSKASQEDRFQNKRAEMYFAAIDWIKNGGALPPEGSEGALELQEALTKTQYFHKNDRLQLEDKDQVKVRIGYSPDEADAFVLTFAEAVSPKKRTMGRPNQSAIGAYRPFSDMERNHNSASAVSIYDPFGGNGRR